MPTSKNTNDASVNKSDARENFLLAALSSEAFERVYDDLEAVPLKLGQVLHESDEPMAYVYFPTDCIVSLLYIMENGETAEIGVVGKDGILGVELFMGGQSTKMCIRDSCNTGASLVSARTYWSGTQLFQSRLLGLLTIKTFLEKEFCALSHL